MFNLPFYKTHFTNSKLLCLVCSVMLIRMGYYTDLDPGHQNSLFRSGSGSKQYEFDLYF